MTMSALSERLVSKMAPAIVRNLNDQKETILGKLGMLPRAALKLAWPKLMEEIHPASVAGVDTILDEFGKLSVTDLVAFLADHARSKGR